MTSLPLYGPALVDAVLALDSRRSQHPSPSVTTYTRKATGVEMTITVTETAKRLQTDKDYIIHQNSHIKDCPVGYGVILGPDGLQSDVVGDAKVTDGNIIAFMDLHSGTYSPNGKFISESLEINEDDTAVFGRLCFEAATGTAPPGYNKIEGSTVTARTCFAFDSILFMTSQGHASLLSIIQGRYTIIVCTVKKGVTRLTIIAHDKQFSS